MWYMFGSFMCFFFSVIDDNPLINVETGSLAEGVCNIWFFVHVLQINNYSYGGTQVKFEIAKG